MTPENNKYRPHYDKMIKIDQKITIYQDPINDNNQIINPHYDLTERVIISDQPQG